MSETHSRSRTYVFEVGPLRLSGFESIRKLHEEEVKVREELAGLLRDYYKVGPYSQLIRARIVYDEPVGALRDERIPALVEGAGSSATKGTENVASSEGRGSGAIPAAPSASAGALRDEGAP